MISLPSKTSQPRRWRGYALREDGCLVLHQTYQTDGHCRQITEGDRHLDRRFTPLRRKYRSKLAPKK